MKNITLTFLLSMVCISIASAQFTLHKLKPKEAQLIKDRQLIVLLAQPNPVDTALFYKQGRRDEIAKLKALCDTFNTAIKEAITARWTLHQEIKYTTMEDYTKNYAKDGRKYVVMRFYSRETNLAFAPYVDFNTGRDKSDRKYLTHPNRFSGAQGLTFIAYTKGEDSMKKDKYFYDYPLPETTPGYLSIYFAIGMNNYYFTNILKKNSKLPAQKLIPDIQAHSKSLSTKTLLVSDEWKLPEFDLETIKTIYPYPVKIVSAQAFTEAIQSKDPALAWHVVWPIMYVRNSPGGNGLHFVISFTHFFIDNATGEPLAIMHPYIHSFMKFYEERDRFLNEEILEKIVRHNLTPLDK